MEWRASWSRNWENVRYCSDRCRRRKVTDEDRALERVILDLLDGRSARASICPSEAAKVLGGDWRARMEPARAAARRLAASGLVEITQGAKPVDPSTAKGPVRIRRRRGVVP
jgi:hypothetical protein